MKGPISEKADRKMQHGTAQTVNGRYPVSWTAAVFVVHACVSNMSCLPMLDQNDH